MEHLYACWRLGHPQGTAADGEPYAYIEPSPGKSLFETIEQSDFPDERTYVLLRGENCFVLLNIFPYTPGHLMVLPKKAISRIEDLPDDTHRELWDLVKEYTQIARGVFNPDGFNIGINEGQAGGGSQPDHLHVHIVPRWKSDTNFLTTIGTTRILPRSLADSWQRIREARVAESK